MIAENKTVEGERGLTQNPDRLQAGGLDISWKSLYRIAGIAALVIVAFTVVQIIVFIANPQPDTVEGWLAMFQNNPLIGLIDMDVLLVVDNILAIPIFLAFYFALRQSGKSLMITATALGLIGIAAYLASNTAFEMLSLSNQYAAAATDIQRTMVLASGQSMLATYEGTAFLAGNFIGGAALLIISIMMLRGNTFSKKTAYTGIVANAVGFGLFIPNTIGIALSIISVAGLAVWWVLVARRFFRVS